MSSRIVRNTTAYTVASLVPNFINLGLLPLYTRLIPPEEYGTMALVVMVTTLLAAISGFQVGNAMTRYWTAYQGDERKKYFTSQLGMIAVTNLIIFGCICLIGPWLTRNAFGSSTFPFDPWLLLGLFQFLFGGLNNYLNITLRMQERGGTFLVLNLIYTVIDLAAGLWLVLGLEMGAIGLLMARCISYGCHTVLLMRSLRTLFWPKPVVFGLVRSLRFSIPVIPHSMGNLLLKSADTYLIGFFLSKSDVGLYDLANRFCRVFARILQGFERAYVPEFMRRSEADKADAAEFLRLVISKWLVWCSMTSLGITLFAEEVIIIMAAPEYHAAYPIVPVLITAALLRGFYYFPANAILFDERTKLIPVITLGSGVVNILLNIILIQELGPIGAAVSTSLSVGLSFYMAWRMAGTQYPVQWPWTTTLITVGGMLGTLAIASRLPKLSIVYSVGAKGLLCLAFFGALMLFNIADSKGDLLRIINKRLRRSGS